MAAIKELIKKLLPKSWILAYHYFLAQVAAIVYWFPSKKLIVIGVTGTNGKSTTVNLIAKILEEAGFTVGLISTVNIKVGEKEWLNDWKMTMPGRFRLQHLLRRMVKNRCQYAVVETSSEGILQYRHLGIDYDTAVFTNLTPEHLDAHGGFDNYKQTKLKLPASVVGRAKKKIGGEYIKRILVANLDDRHAKDFLDFDVDQKYGYAAQANVIASDSSLRGPSSVIASPPLADEAIPETASADPDRPRSDAREDAIASDSSLRAQLENGVIASPQTKQSHGHETAAAAAKAGPRSDISRDDKPARSDGLEVIELHNFAISHGGIRFKVSNIEFSLKLLGLFDLYNSGAAITAAQALGIDLQTAKRALEKVEGVPGRMEMIKMGQPFTVLVDYSPEPVSLAGVYKTLEYWNKRKVIHTLGSTGGGRDKARRSILGYIAGDNADYVIVTNEDPYDDDPGEIIDDVAAGAAEAGLTEGEEVFKILDRREGIRKALKLAQENDLVLITGKGAEQAMVVKGNKKIPWDDREVVREELSKLGYKN